MSRTPEAQAHVELAPSVGVPQGPSEANDQRLRPDASDDALRRSQGLDQVANQGWVAYFNCHCRCHAPRVAAGEARTSHFRQKRSAVKGAATNAEPRPPSAASLLRQRRLLAAPQDAGNPYARELELEFYAGSNRKGFLLPYPPATQFETVNRSAQAELPLPQASEPARPAARRLELSPLAGRAAAEPRSVSDEARRLEGRFVLTGYRSWH